MQPGESFLDFLHADVSRYLNLHNQNSLLKENYEIQDTDVPATDLSRDGLNATQAGAGDAAGHIPQIEAPPTEINAHTTSQRNDAPRTTSSHNIHQYDPFLGSTTRSNRSLLPSDSLQRSPMQFHATRGLEQSGSGIPSGSYLPSTSVEPRATIPQLPHTTYPEPPPPNSNSNDHIFSGAPAFRNESPPQLPHPPPLNTNIDAFFSIILPLLSTISQNFTTSHASLQSEVQKIHEYVARDKGSHIRRNASPTTPLPSRTPKASRESRVYPKTSTSSRKSSVRATASGVANGHAGDELSSDEEYHRRHDPYYGEPELNHYRVSTPVFTLVLG